MEVHRKQTLPVRAQLGLWDAVSIIVGIVIGAGIYETAPLVFSNVSGPWMALGVWGLGGVLSLIGALCYAELATTYPRIGGDYVYLSRAYGAWAGFFFGWAQLAVILTGSIGMMAYVFADYAVRLWPGPAYLYAVLAVVVLSSLNVLGVTLGKGTQNLLSTAKVLGLGGIIVAGFIWGQAGPATFQTAAAGSSSFGLAMIFVLYTYGGWNDAAFVAAELQDRRRNIPLALVLGTAAITVIYLLVNTGYLLGLGFEKAQKSSAIAADVLQLSLEPFSANAAKLGSQVMCLLVMISALSAVNGLIFTGSRVYSALGSEHSIFAPLAQWHPRWESPVWSLLAQALITLALITAVGTDLGRAALDGLVTAAGLEPLSWQGHGGFDTLLRCTAPVFWLFFLLTGLSLFVLRIKDKDVERPFRVPLYPVLPLIFCCTCGYMLYSSADYAGKLVLIGITPLLVGLPLYALSRRRPVKEMDSVEVWTGQ